MAYTTTTERQRYWLERLEQNVATAAARLARVQDAIDAAREAGIDTSAYDPRTSAQSGDYTLRQLEGRLVQRVKELDAYRSKLGLPTSNEG
jgi:hypothetical protein